MCIQVPRDAQSTAACRQNEDALQDCKHVLPWPLTAQAARGRHQSTAECSFPSAVRQSHAGSFPPSLSSLPNLSDFFKVVQVTAHEERCGSHDEVQHLTRQDGHKGVLPLQGVEVDQEALGDERQQGPV